MILKICGITNQADATAAIQAGATAVGFNFYPRSPRYIAPEQAAEILSAKGVLRVGVFVNEPRGRVEEIARIARLDVAQLHGDEPPADYPHAGGTACATTTGPAFSEVGQAVVACSARLRTILSRLLWSAAAPGRPACVWREADTVAAGAG